ncbi:MAG TPA: sugar ABC transporter permease, partial [Pseudolabrys sp.]|nr:sugar ABC transporter permease [Pseudolabrys sp.]
MADTVQQWRSTTGAAAAPRAITGLRRVMRRRSTIAFLMCLPLILLVVCLIIYPALYSIHLSMLNKHQTRFI